MASRGQPVFFILIKIENINICLVTNRVRLQKDYSPLCVGSICLTCLQRARTCLWRLGKILPTEEKNDEQCLIEYTFLYYQISNKHTQWNKFKSLEYAFLVKLFNPWVGRGYTFWTIRSVKSIKSAPMVNVLTRGEEKGSSNMTILRSKLKAYVSEEILNWHCLSLNADLCIHFYWPSRLRQASHRNMIQRSRLRLCLFVCLLYVPLSTAHLDISKSLQVLQP